MTPLLPPELALLRADLAAAAARRRARRRRWPRVAGLSVLVSLSIGTAAVATGVVPSPFAGDPTTVTVVGPRGEREQFACTRSARGELCRTRAGAGVGPAQLARALAARGAEFGIMEATSRGAATAYHRTGIRVGPRAAGAGGYRGIGPITITITVDGGAPFACPRGSRLRACRAYRDAVRGTPDFPRLLRTLGATRVTIETTTRCRLAARYECEGAPRAVAIRRSADPRTIPERGVTYAYSKVTVTRR